MGSSDPLFIVERLIVDSLLFLRVLPRTDMAIIDVGSGAGLPGIPLKIVEPELELTMLESRRRRASFLMAAVRGIPLENTYVVHARAEEAVARLGRKFEAAVMRAVSDPERMVPVAAKLVKPGGLVLVSGPPDPRPTTLGRWLTVPGLGRADLRNFLIHDVVGD